MQVDLQDIPKKYYLDNVLYCMTVYHAKTDKYYYKVGFTNELEKRIRQINSQFNAGGQIFVNLLTNVKSQRFEKQMVHPYLKKHSPHRLEKAVRYGSTFCTKSGEVYPFSHDVFQVIKKAFRGHSTDKHVFEGDVQPLSDQEDSSYEYYDSEDDSDDSQGDNDSQNDDSRFDQDDNSDDSDFEQKTKRLRIV